MTFDEYLATTREEIKERLTSFLETQKSETLPEIFKEQRLIDSLLDFALRGKLLRGTLFLFMVDALGVRLEKKHYDSACAIELMHSALLIQDDIIDRDEKRRGAPTIFARYENEGKKLSAFDPYHYGVSSAIMVSDVAFFFAIELLAEYRDPKLPQLLKFYAHEVYLVAVAESVDSIFGQTKREASEEEIYAIYKYKTARYTFSLPFEMAAIVADSDPATRERLARLGENAGIIFQLKDDEIGLFGSEEVIGKPVGSDIRENKKTIIRSLLYQHVNDEDRHLLDGCFGNPDASEQQLQQVKMLYEKCRIGEHISEELKRIMDNVWEDYDSIKMKPSSKEILKGLLEFNINRSY